ncbi:MAG TPA: hypothetical protein VIA63_04325 [Candidatus Limnocylindria bacterium]|jgi:hypothetical protein
MRRGRADVDADGPQLQPFGRDVPGVLVLVVTKTAMRTMRMAVGMRVLRDRVRRGR